MKQLLDCILDALLDSAKILPFLFFAYLAMEYIEHKMGERTKREIERAGALGPVFGSVLGVIPQCGFSTVASNLFAGRIITVGTLLAVYLSTSDEMLPIFISESVPVVTMVKILGVKCLIAMVAGFLIDAVLRLLTHGKKEEMMSGDLCEHEHCHCEKSILKSSLVHTVKIILFIFLISAILNILIAIVGEDSLKQLIGNRPVITCFVAGLVGLIPNCAASVVITELFLEHMISVGAMFSGLLVGAGVGLLVLFRVNEHWKENVKIVALLYGIGVGAGLFLEWLFPLIGFTI
ncbi:MAG: putative manganese transporter [Lachnospiraceae bacterium]|nr:putative manganese transporter [Lachnospiraceae bacterium]